MCFIKSVYKPLEFYGSVIPNSCDQNNFKLPFFTTETSLPNLFQFSSQLPINYVDPSLQNWLANSMQARLKKQTQSLNFINDVIFYQCRKISQCDNKIDDLLKLLQESNDEVILIEKDRKPMDSKCITSMEKSGQKEEESENQLTRKLFGERKYKYKLDLKEKFSRLIYKERNINVNVQLTNRKGAFIKNSNVLNLCLGLADDNGNWITMNRVSDPMLKGKTEVELYHGEAEFNKIYTKDISRTFPNGRVNIVIYAKPSILIYDGLTSDYEEHVDAETLEPLVLQEVIIKAKKKY